MKTNKIFAALLAGICVLSCSTPYKIATYIHKDGSATREVYAWGDSAFMAGNTAHNPFPFAIDSNWTITRFDSAFHFAYPGGERKTNTKAVISLPAIEQFTRFLNPLEEARPLLLPEESMKKRFRWFYTYYAYEGVYSSLSSRLPVSPDVFLTPEEQKLWFQGDMSSLQGMNGIEINEVLNNIEQKFEKWFLRCQYEISFNLIAEQARLSGDTQYVPRLSALKDTLFTTHYSRESPSGIELTDVSQLFDDYFKTRYFSELVTRNKEELELLIEKEFEVIETFNHLISYELSMPGSIFDTNAPLRSDGMLVWKIDAPRMLANDYVIFAESRVTNHWAFAVTLLLAVLALWCLGRAYRQRK